MGPKSTVKVDIGARGAWSVAPSADQAEQVVCATLAEARDVAYRWAGEHRPCELIVRDAYHRVVRRELVNGNSS
jgi:hypothetical protein